jgi:hypothetical protein
MRTLILVLAGTYAATMAGVATIGLVPTVPWLFLALVVMMIVPLAVALTALGNAVGARCARHGIPIAPVGIALGLMVAWLHRLQSPRLQAIAAVLLVTIGWAIVRRRVTNVRLVVWSLVALVLGYGTIWNLNYVAARATAGRLHDAWLRDLDLACYGWLAGRPIATIAGLFPLVDARPAFALLENAYGMLFTEVGLTILVLVHVGRPLVRFFVALFACYAVGLLVFVVYPTVGPCIFEPDSFRAAFHDTFTYGLMQRMAQEYAAVAAGTTGNGAAYFVALPSLHVAVVTLLQRTLAVSRPHFWMMLPVNLLLAASTVLLGYHYLVDVPAGIAVALGVAWCAKRRDA